MFCNLAHFELFAKTVEVGLKSTILIMPRFYCPPSDRYENGQYREGQLRLNIAVFAYKGWRRHSSTNQQPSLPQHK